MSETSELVRPALIALCKRWPEGVWVRRNVGAARFRSKKRGVSLVRFNLPGMADIYGIWHGLAWELEAKLPGEVSSEDQVNWGKAVVRAGGIYVVFYDTGDLLKTVDRRWRLAVEHARETRIALTGL